MNIQGLKKAKMEYQDDLTANFEDILSKIGRSKHMINTILYLFHTGKGARMVDIAKHLERKKQQTYDILGDLCNLGIAEKIKTTISGTTIYRLKNGDSFYRGVICFVSHFYFSKFPEKLKGAKDES